MTFLSVVKSIGGVFNKINAVVQPLEPAIAAIPVYGPAFDTIFNTVMSVENLFAGSVSGLGAAKKTVATTIVNATAPEPIDSAALAMAIDQIVTAMNTLHSAQAAVSAKK